MIIDFNSAQAPSEYKAKICIVGSGIIGLTLLSEFLDFRQHDIVLVESGGLNINSKLESMDQVRNTGDVESGVSGSRARLFGGTGLLWGGQVLPFNELDFEHRSWVNNADWPIEFRQLEEFYQRASGLLGLDDTKFSENIWSRTTDVKSQINHHLLDLTFSKWSPRSNFGEIYKNSIKQSSHITLLTNASVVKINLADSPELVNSINLNSLSGHQGKVKADVFVLCCGGIDNARILLASNDTLKSGVANKHGNVGKYYQDHIGFYGASLIPNDINAFHNLFSNFLLNKQKYLPKLVLSEALQVNEQLLSVNGNISIQANADSLVSNMSNFYATLRSQGLNMSNLKSLVSLVKSPVELFKIINCYYLKHRKYFPKDAGYFLIANCETEPSPESCITLTDERDILGMPKVQINWKISDLSRKTLLKFYQVINKELARLEIAEVKIRPELYECSNDWKQRCYSLYHHIGATRMSSDPSSGVVDPDCRIHDVNNLYIAGTSVFPTSGCANPTFTAMALAIRLADHIKEKEGL